MIATRRAIDLAVRHNHRFHVLHVSTGDEADFIGEYLAEAGAGRPGSPSDHGRGLPAPSVAQLDDYARLGTLAQMNPSLKTADDNRRLWEALPNGRIQVIATDHAPHTLEEKAKPYPAVALRHAECREQPGADAERGAPRPLHARASRALDVRRAGPRVGHRRQGPHRGRLRRRPGAGRSARDAQRFATKSSSPSAAGAPGTASSSPAGPFARGCGAAKYFATAGSMTPSAASRPSSTTPAAAIGRRNESGAAGTTDQSTLTALVWR